MDVFVIVLNDMALRVFKAPEGRESMLNYIREHSQLWDNKVEDYKVYVLEVLD